jgi:hypothetical protein
VIELPLEPGKTAREIRLGTAHLNLRITFKEGKRARWVDQSDLKGGNVKPTLGRIVHYRGKQGYQAMRAAIVTGTVDSLDPRGVEAGAVPALDSNQHVHLWVFTPGDKGGFPEYNVPPGDGPGEWTWPPRV